MRWFVGLILVACSAEKGDPDVLATSADPSDVSGQTSQSDCAVNPGPDLDQDGFFACEDCNDASPDIFPGAPEQCNGLDDSCSGTVDLEGGVGVCVHTGGSNQKVDVLLVVDNSCSMSEEQAQLASQFPSLINTYLASGLDFHVGVTSTDTSPTGAQGRLTSAPGANQDLWIDQTTVDPIATFQAMSVLGTSGSFEEKGLDAAWYALDTHSQPGGTNEGFLREEADLKVVVLSDENDASTAITPNDFVLFLEGLKVSPDQVGFHSFVAMNAGCGASIGQDYMSVSSATSGLIESICDTDWTDAFLDLAGGGGATTGDRDFTLENPADPGSITAEVVDYSGTVSAIPNSEIVYRPSEWVVTLPGSYFSDGEDTVTIWYAMPGGGVGTTTTSTSTSVPTTSTGGTSTGTGTAP